MYFGPHVCVQRCINAVADAHDIINVQINVLHQPGYATLLPQATLVRHDLAVLHHGTILS